ARARPVVPHKQHQQEAGNRAFSFAITINGNERKPTRSLAQLHQSKKLCPCRLLLCRLLLRRLLLRRPLDLTSPWAVLERVSVLERVDECPLPPMRQSRRTLEV